MTRRGRPPAPGLLTPRETEVLALIRDGLSNREIAEALGISLQGVKYHVTEILAKLGVSSREEAASWKRAGGISFLVLLLGAMPRLSKSPKVFSGVILALVAGTVVLAMVVAISERRKAPATSAEVLSEAPAQTLTEVPEQSPGSFGPYRLGYLRGYGILVDSDASHLTVSTQTGQSVFSIDDETQFLWASDGAIHFDHRTDGLQPGVSVMLSFNSPLTDAAARVTPVDTVLIGYFRYLHGTVVVVGDGYVDVRIDSQFVGGDRKFLSMTDDVLRVWLDWPLIATSPSSSENLTLEVGTRLAFGGLVTADGYPVASWLLLQ